MSRTKTFLVSAAVAAILLPASSDARQRTFIDLDYHGTQYKDLVVPLSPIPVRVVGRWLQNDIHAPDGDIDVTNSVGSVLVQSGVFTPSPGAEDTLIVEMNDVGDFGKDHHEGFMTGLTLGASKATIVENFEFNIYYRSASGLKRFGRYDHSVITTLNIKERPPGVGRETTGDNAGLLVIQDVVLRFLSDLQANQQSPNSLMFVRTGKVEE